MTQIERLHQIFLADQEEALGRLAVRRGLISEEQLSAALAELRSGSRRLGTILAERGWMKTDALLALIDDQVQEELTRLSLSQPAAAPPEVQALLSNPSMNLDEFTLVSRLGRGGAGEVWKAWDRQLGRWVAIKRPIVLPDSAESMERFRREVLATARLSHPNIVPIYRVAERDGRPYIVMQLVEGRTLDQVRLPVRRALEVARAVAHGVHHAHQHGVVHRDLKPENIMVDDAGGVWVLDFGLANLLEGRSITVTGSVMGTPAYMSPEQARGDAASREPSTDVYSLGATLFALVTGRPPFDGASMAEVVNKVVEREPAPPRKIDPHIPQEVETIVLKAMEKAVERRYPTALAMAEDIQRYLDGEPIQAKRASVTYRLKKKISKHRWLAAASAVALAAMGGLGIYVMVQAGETSRLQAAAAEDFRLAEAETDPVEKLRLYERAGRTLPEARARAKELGEAISLGRRQLKEAKPYFDQGLDRFRTLDRLLGLAEDRSAEIDASAREAIACFTRALELYPAYGEAALQIARVQFEIRKRDEALQWCDRALSLSPELTTAYLLRGVINTDRYEKMRHDSHGGKTRPESEEAKSLEKLIQEDLALAQKWHKDVAELDFAQGMLHFAKGDYAPAAERLEAYLKRVPSDGRALTLCAHAFFHASQFDKTVEWSTRGIQLRPRQASNYNERGIARFRKGDWDGAIDDYTQALQLEPGRAGPLFNRGQCRATKKQFDLAIEDFEEALKLDPRNRTAYFSLADSLVRTSNLSRAIDTYTRALEVFPNDPEAYHLRGSRRRMSRDYRGAVDDLKIAAQLDPENPNVRGDYGLALEALARRTPSADRDLLRAAAKELETALSIADAEWRNREMIEKHLEDVQKLLAAPK